MPLNKNNGNMYPWVTHTWNPIGGCEHDCSYCYVKRIEKRTGSDLHTPCFREGYLKDNLGEGNTIFVGSSGDMWGKWGEPTQITAVISHTNRFPKNTYIFQSKYPGNFMLYWVLFSDATILAATIETNRPTLAVSKAPDVSLRMIQMLRLGENLLHWESAIQLMVSIEPVMDFDIEIFLGWFKYLTRVNIVSIGADTGRNGLPEPDPGKLVEFIRVLREICTDVRLKPNLKRLLPEGMEV